MTVVLLLVWFVLTRAGSTTSLWPGSPPASDKQEQRPPLDTTAVSLEAGVAALALTIIPWAMFSQLFATWEVIGLLAMWPLIARYGVDRLLKLRSGHLVEVTPEGLVVPGLPRRLVKWSDLRGVDRRRVRFGPDDIVFRAKSPVPVVIDTQFCEWSEDDLAAWAAVTADRHVPRGV